MAVGPKLGLWRQIHLHPLAALQRCRFPTFFIEYTPSPSKSLRIYQSYPTFDLDKRKMCSKYHAPHWKCSQETAVLGGAHRLHTAAHSELAIQALDVGIDR